MASRLKSWAKIRNALYKHATSLKATSKSKSDDFADTWGSPPCNFVVHGKKISSIRVCDFDKLQRIWYPAKKGRNVPCSVDAVKCDDDGMLYAIEFKIGRVESSNLIRKIHESIMGIKEHLSLMASFLGEYDFYRRHMVYLVVASELEVQNAYDKTFYRSLSAFERPWEQPSYPVRWHLKPLEGVVISKTYELSPSMFERFVKIYRWA